MFISISFKFAFSSFVIISVTAFFLASYYFYFLNFFNNAAKIKIIAIKPITPTIITIKTKRDIPVDESSSVFSRVYIVTFFLESSSLVAFDYIVISLSI